MRRSNLLVLLGIAFFLVGGVIVLLITNDDDGGSNGSDAKTVVVVPTEDVKAGDLANDLVKAKRLKEIEVPVSEVLPGAVQSLSQLTGATFTQGFGKDQQIVQTGLLLKNRTFDVPKGYEAVAVQLDFIGGGAGYISPGDRINLYASLGSGPYAQPASEVTLMLANVEVLDVNLTIPPRRGQGATTTPDATNGARATGDNITYLLALKTADAEKVIFATEYQSMYASLPAADSPAPGNTPGANNQNIVGG